MSKQHLVICVACSCGSALFFVGKIAGGFACGACKVTRRKGAVIKCYQCGATICGMCITKSNPNSVPVIELRDGAGLPQGRN